MKNSLAVKNLLGKPVRTFILILLTMLLTLSVLSGTLLVQSLRSGLSSLENRLGADIMVVPKEATSKQSFENIVLQGSTGYFYMDNARAEQVLQREGIGQVSEQFFLATTKSGCCSIPVQIIGIDQDSDFTVSPWINKSSSKRLGYCEIAVGNELNAFVGDTLSFYGVQCKVAAKLDRTGTSFDTTVFTGIDTIKELIRSSSELKLNVFGEVDPDRVVSCIMINAAEGYTPEEIVNDINLHVKKVRAIQTKEMISGISDSLGGIKSIIGLLTCAVWALCLVILVLAFTMTANERKKEFAVLRVIGATQARLSKVVMGEALYASLAGSVIGSLLGLLAVVGFNSLIESALGLPFLLPNAGTLVLVTAFAVGVSVIACSAAAAISAYRISRIDTAAILRGEN